MSTQEKIQKHIYITYSLPIKRNKDGKIITYKLKFIDSCRFMQSKLSDLADNYQKLMIKNEKNA